MRVGFETPWRRGDGRFMPNIGWPVYAENAVADICRKRAGLIMPKLASPDSGLCWPIYAEHQMAGLCRTVTQVEQHPIAQSQQAFSRDLSSAYFYPALFCCRANSFKLFTPHIGSKSIQAIQGCPARRSHFLAYALNFLGGNPAMTGFGFFYPFEFSFIDQLGNVGTADVEKISGLLRGEHGRPDFAQLLVRNRPHTEYDRFIVGRVDAIGQCESAIRLTFSAHSNRAFMNRGSALQ